MESLPFPVPEALEPWVPYIVGAALALLIFIIFPALCYLSFQNSFGGKFVECAPFRANRKRELPFGPFYVRGLLLPITSLLSIVGVFPGFLKGQSIADIFSNTAFCSLNRIEE